MKDFSNSEEILFQKCIELPPDRRQAFLDESCQGDPELKDSVLRLLKSYESADTFMSQEPDKDSVMVSDHLKRIAPTDESPGDYIGRYRLLELLGEGASGSVWMALQTEDIERKVALKILKLGMDTKEFLVRFESERQVLAMMDHPNVARVLDAGATDYGRPYFVMELVRGVPLLEYCDRKQLTIEERVKLCIKICHGLEHAHQKGIIHRDLKPSNILVGIKDDEADPRIIDFGIAKTTNLRLNNKTLYTGIHTFLGTPVYSSPEQLECSSFEVDHRSDIYSIGALLYEVLVGLPPFEHKMLSKLGLKDLQTFVRNEDPDLPSVCFQKLSVDAQNSIAINRRSTRSRIQSRLKGELDWIILKCLEKEPGRRYETALDLLQDLQAYLDGDMVTAAAPSVGYKIKKFVQRKRPAYAIWLELTAVTLAVLLIVSLLRPGETVISGANGLVFTDHSIAVLPLENLSPDPENRFFADGVHEDIITFLSAKEDLLVISRSTMRQYKESVKTPGLITNELGVRYLVEGSVRRSDHRVLVSIQLLEPQTGRQLWSGYFERDMDDTFAVQKTIAAEVANQVDAALGNLIGGIVAGNGGS
jgi:eukaryotic-like serine/threonine-protein kinase